MYRYVAYVYLLALEARVECYRWSHDGKQNQQNKLPRRWEWHDDAPEEPKMMKNVSDDIKDD